MENPIVPASKKLAATIWGDAAQGRTTSQLVAGKISRFAGIPVGLALLLIHGLLVLLVLGVVLGVVSVARSAAKRLA